MSDIAEKIPASFSIEPKFLARDLLAGLTGAVAGAPQAMGFALIAGINPVYGLYTAIVATIIGALTTGSRFITIAPTNALALVVMSTLVRPDEPVQIEKLFVLTLLVGVFQLLFGILQLGKLIHFVSNAVMTGFIAGAGLLIILGQLPNLTGYTIPSDVTGTIPKFLDWLSHIPQSDPATAALGIACLIALILLFQTRLKILAPIIVIVVAGLLAAGLQLNTVEIVSDIGEIPPGFPAPALPDLQLAPELALAALAMAVLALVQSAGITQNFPEPDGRVANVNRDFIGQGIANLVGSLFHGMPAGGSLSRTAISKSAGAKTRFANIFAGAFVALILLVFGDFVERIPLTALAAQLIVAAALLLKWRRIEIVWSVGKAGRTAMVATFLATLFVPLEFSIYIGVGISLALYIYTSSQNLEVVRLIPFNTHQFREAPLPERLPDHEPIIISVTGHLYFAAVNRLDKLLPPPKAGEGIPVVILRLRDNKYLGSTGIQLLKRYNDELEAHGGKLILAGIGERVNRQLSQTGMIDYLGSENVFTADLIIFHSTEDALASAREWVENREITT